MNLSAEMARLPEPPNDSKPPMWDYWRHDLWRRAQEDDPHNFMRWPCIYHTMSQNHWLEAMIFEQEYVRQRTNGLFRVAEDLERWREWEPLSGTHNRNLAHQAYHILRWQEVTGQRISDMQSIYEFGGGYGAMALACNRLGFKGKYYIYDLPEFSLLQRWYLEECGVGNVEWHSEYPAEFTKVDLLIACYSLSETDYEERERILSHIATRSYLLLYSNKFETYDNIDFFQGQNWSLAGMEHWRHEHIEHLPPESWYSWGW